jgi:hypothetical protein
LFELCQLEKDIRLSLSDIRDARLIHNADGNINFLSISACSASGPSCFVLPFSTERMQNYKELVDRIIPHIANAGNSVYPLVSTFSHPRDGSDLEYHSLSGLKATEILVEFPCALAGWQCRSGRAVMTAFGIFFYPHSRIFPKNIFICRNSISKISAIDDWRFTGLELKLLYGASIQLVDMADGPIDFVLKEWWKN